MTSQEMWVRFLAAALAAGAPPAEAALVADEALQQYRHREQRLGPVWGWREQRWLAEQRAGRRRPAGD